MPWKPGDRRRGLGRGGPILLLVTCVAAALVVLSWALDGGRSSTDRSGARSDAESGAPSAGRTGQDEPDEGTAWREEPPAGREPSPALIRVGLSNIGGRVFDAAGKPMRAGHVFLQAGERSVERATLGEAGSFALFATSARGEVANLLVTVPGYAPCVYRPNAADPSRALPDDWLERNDLILEIGQRLPVSSFRLVWADDSPAAGLVVWPGPGNREAARADLAVVVGPAGWAHFDRGRFSRDLTHMSVAWAQEAAPFWTQDLRVLSSPVIRLPPTFQVKVAAIVLQASGAPLPVTPLTACVEDVRRIVWTNLKGACNILGVKPSVDYQLFLDVGGNEFALERTRRESGQPDLWKAPVNISPNVRLVPPREMPESLGRAIFRGYIDGASVEIASNEAPPLLSLPAGVHGISGNWEFEKAPPTEVRASFTLTRATEVQEVEIPLQTNGFQARPAPALLLDARVTFANGDGADVFELHLATQGGSSGTVTARLHDPAVQTSYAGMTRILALTRTAKGRFRTWLPRTDKEFYLRASAAFMQQTFGPFSVREDEEVLKVEFRFAPLRAVFGRIGHVDRRPVRQSGLIYFERIGGRRRGPLMTWTNSLGHWMINPASERSILDVYLVEDHHRKGGGAERFYRLLAAGLRARDSPFVLSVDPAGR